MPDVRHQGSGSPKPEDAHLLATFLAHLHDQIKDLPDGQQVTLCLTDGNA